MKPDTDPGWFSLSRTSMERLTQKIINTNYVTNGTLVNNITQTTVLENRFSNIITPSITSCYAVEERGVDYKALS